MLVGVVLPADAEAMRDMAYVFAEEFARHGLTAESRSSGCSRIPSTAAHMARIERSGETEILAIIDECLAVWGRIRVPFKTFNQFKRDSLSSPASRGRKEIEVRR